MKYTAVKKKPRGMEMEKVTEKTGKYSKTERETELKK